MDDRALVAGIRSGDTGAFQQLFRATFPGLCIAVTPYAGSRAEAEEIIQDLFFALWERRATLDIRGSLGGYLYVGALNRARNLRRRGRVVAKWEAGGAIRDETSVEPVDRRVEEIELAAAIQCAIDALPPKGREIFLLNRSKHLTYDQVAARMGISVKTVETHMGRALRTLRQSLAIFLP
jgi:RNA polymerase sigma-70 factor (ECF subfamily)